jgi:hypothetical protein
MDEFLTLAVKVAAIIGSLGIPTLIGIYLRNRQEDEKEMRKAQCRETVLILEGIQSIGKLAYATAIAYKNGKPNGEMADAIESYSDFAPRLSKHLTEQAVENTH